MQEAEENHWLSVTEEPSGLAAISERCRKAIVARADAVLDAVPAIRGYVLSEWVEILEQDRERSIARLKRFTLSDDLTRAGVNAAIFLCRLLQPEGLPYLRRVIEEGNEELKIDALKGIGDSFRGTDRETAQGEFWLSDHLLVLAVLKQLYDGSEKVVDEAVTVCGKLRLEQARKRLLELARNPGKANLGSVLHWLARWPLTDELLEIGIKASQESIGTKFRQTSLILEAACSPDTSFRRRAKIELQRQLDDWPCGNDYAHLGYRPQVAGAAAKCCTAEDLPWLRKRIEEDDGWSARELLRALVRLEGAAGIYSLKKAIRDRRHRASAFSIAAKLFKDSANEELTRDIASYCPELEGEELAGACEALTEIGGQFAIDAAKSNFGRLAGWKRSQLEARIDAPSLEQIVSAVLEEGMIDVPTAEAIKSALEKNEILRDQNRKPRLIDVLFAAGIVAWFDVETDQLPCRHDLLVQRLGEASRGGFSPKAISEEWHQKKDDDYDADYTLRFIHAGRGYVGRIRNFGDWYDVERTVIMVNRAVSDAGTAERFVAIDSGDQSAILVFARPDRLEVLAQKFHLPLLKYMNKSMEVGVEFERQVADNLRDYN